MLFDEYKSLILTFRTYFAVKPDKFVKSKSFNNVINVE